MRDPVLDAFHREGVADGHFEDVGDLQEPAQIVQIQVVACVDAEAGALRLLRRAKAGTLGSMQ